MSYKEQVILTVVPELVMRIFFLAAVGASMKAIDSNEEVKSQNIHTYNYLIFIVIILTIQMLGYIYSGASVLLQ